MLSLEKCRRHLAPNTDLCDHELEQLRNRLTALAEVAVDQALAGSRTVKEALLSGVAAFSGALLAVPEDDRHAIEERAAIMEFEGGQSRQQAEHGAVQEYSRRRRRRW